jgi:hypothetical protein
MVCCSAETAIAALPVPRAALARNWNLPSCSGADGETTAADVHATLCTLVMREAAKHSAWTEYAAAE